MFCINSIIKCSFAFCVLRSTAPICVNGVGKQWLRLQCVHPVDSMCLNQTSCIWSIKNIIVYVRTATTYELEACRLCASLLHYAWLPFHDVKNGCRRPADQWHASHWTWKAFGSSYLVILEIVVIVKFRNRDLVRNAFCKFPVIQVAFELPDWFWADWSNMHRVVT